MHIEHIEGVIHAVVIEKDPQVEARARGRRLRFVSGEPELKVLVPGREHALV